MSAPPPPGPGAVSDAELILAVAEQDRVAFVVLFERYAGRVKAYLMRRGARSADADEVTQDVMVAIWRRATTYDPSRASAATWIFAIARNRRIDLIRREVRETPDVDDPFWHPEAEPDGFAAFSAAEREARLRDAIGGLPEAQRQVLVAAFYDGLSHGEIAAREGLPLGTVKSRIRLAFRYLQGILGPDLAEGMSDD